MIQSGCAVTETTYDRKYVKVHRVQNKEHKVHGQMAKYFNKCLAIYKIIWSFHVIMCIKIDQILRKKD